MIRRAAWAVLAVVCGTGVIAAQAKKPKDPKGPYLKLAEPWPDAEGLLRRKAVAEQLALFSTNDPLLLVIKADFKAIDRDRTVNSAKRFPGTLTTGADAPEKPSRTASTAWCRRWPCARSIDLPRTLFSDLDQESLTTMALFEYMIAYTDVSIIKLHNVKLMAWPTRRTPIPIPSSASRASAIAFTAGRAALRMSSKPCWRSSGPGEARFLRCTTPCLICATATGRERARTSTTSMPRSNATA